MNATPRLDTLVTGCGRSGTGFMAGLISHANIPCGHEAIFKPTGNDWNSTPRCESSWYAAPFIKDLKPDTKILHVVRDPINVMISFYKIGMLAWSPIQHVTKGYRLHFLKTALQKRPEALQRMRYVAAHRRYLRQHTQLFDLPSEEKRLEAYWRDWNLMVEESAKTAGHPYLRIRIEDIDTTIETVRAFLNLPALPTKTKTISRNQKIYRRTVPSTFDLDTETLELAQRYGYRS